MEFKILKKYTSSTIAPIILVISISVLVYANSINNGFTLDDTPYLVNSHYIKELNNIFTIFTPAYLKVPPGEVDINRPVMTWSLIIEYFLWGLAPKGYHLSNILLHTINSILLYFFVLMFLNNKRTALLSAILFVAHPVHTEAVDGINYREDLLVTSFYLISAILFLKMIAHEDKRRLYFISTLLAFIFALLSKEMAVTLPVILLLLHIIKLKSLKRTIYDGCWFYLSCSLILGIYTVALFLLYLKTYFSSSSFAFLTYAIDSNPSDNLQFIPPLGKMFGYFLKFLLFPINSSHAYDIKASNSLFEALPLISLFLVGWLIIYALKTLKTNPKVAFPVLWFFVTLIPVATTIYRQPLAERFLYLPSIGPTILLAVATCWIFEIAKRQIFARYAAVTITAIALMSYAVITMHRNNAWENDEVLLRATLKSDPMDQHSHLSLGLYYSHLGDYVHALDEYQKALNNKPPTLTPVYKDEALTEMGKIYFDLGDHAVAIDLFQKALEYFPQNIDARFYLALTYSSMGLKNEAVTELRKVLKAAPNAIFKRLNEYETARSKNPNSLVVKAMNKRISEIEKLSTISW